MRISDWSSDVCSSDLGAAQLLGGALPAAPGRRLDSELVRAGEALLLREDRQALGVERGGEGLGDGDHLGGISGAVVAPVDEREGQGRRLRRVEVGGQAGIGNGVEPLRSEERRGGEVCVSQCRYWGWA